MDRSEILPEEQIRDYDHMWFWRDSIIGLGQAVMDVLGKNGTVVSGFAATPTSPASLTIDLAAGDIYELSAVDSTAYGSLAADSNLIMQQGISAATTQNLTTAGLTSGQSQWVLISATFAQTDIIRPDDPNGGVYPFINTSNLLQPFFGPGGDGATLPDCRAGEVTIAVSYGTPSSGSPIPPSPSSGYVPLYLIELSYGQTTITSGEILVAGAAAYSGYTQAPFLAGLLNSHHNGSPGQAPKIMLGSEVQGYLPFTSMYVTNTSPPVTGGDITQGGLIPIESIVNTNPNGNVEGAVGDLVIDSATNTPYWCETAGIASAAVWNPLTGGLQPINVTTAPYTATSLGAIYTVSYAGALAFTMAKLLSGVTAQVIIVNNNSYTVTVSPYAGQTINGGSSYAFTGQGATVAFYKDPSSATNWLAYQLITGTTGGLNALQIAGGSNAVGGAAAAPAFNSYDSAITFGGASNARPLPTTGTITGEYWHTGNWVQTGAITANHARIHIAGNMTINNTWTINTEMAGGGGVNGGAVNPAAQPGAGLGPGQGGAPGTGAIQGGGGGGFGGAGGVGGTNGGSTPTNNAGNTYPISACLSGSGGAGGTGSGGFSNGGAGGGSLLIECTGNVTLGSSCTMTATGAAGSATSSSAYSTGGGGSGGGIKIICWGVFTNGTSCTISANGGAGGNGSGGNLGAGGGGGGGIIEIYDSSHVNNGTITVSGGAAGTGSSGTAATAGSSGVMTFNDFIVLQRSPG